MKNSFPSPTRRGFLRSAAASAGLLSLGPLTGLDHLMADEDDTPGPRDWAVRYHGDIEPIVRLMEETPLDPCIEKLAVKLRQGMSYRQFLSALFLAGLRNGGDLGYYHCIYMIHSAHYMSMNAPLEERIMGLFGGLGAFKSWQARRYDGDVHFGWRKKPTNLPPPDKALERFRESITHEDPDGAEAAMIMLAQTHSNQQLLDFFVPYVLGNGVHAWICASNLFRLFPAIGWRHAEPALRMMARTFSASSHWYVNWLKPRLAEARKEFGPLPVGWTDSRGEKAATVDFMAMLRQRDRPLSLKVAYELLAKGKIRAGSIWDAIHLVAGEQYVGSRGSGDYLHQCTGMNAMHYTFRSCIDPEVRLLALMQAVTWTAKWGACRFKGSAPLLEWGPESISPLPQVAAEQILYTSLDDNVIGKGFAFAQQHPHSQAVWEVQRRATFGAGTDGHSYKFLAAVWEDAYQVSEHWRAHKFASVFGGASGGVPGTSTIILRARDALRGA